MPSALDSKPVAAGRVALLSGFDQFLSAVDQGGLDQLDDLAFEAELQSFERLRNRLALVDHHFVQQIVERDLPDLWCQGSPARVLASRLRISKAEATRRVRAAEAVGSRVTMQGESLDPLRPNLAAAQRAGDISTEHLAVIDDALRKVDRRGYDRADVEAGEKLLTDDARLFGPEDLRRLATRVVDGIDPDGTLPDDDLNEDRREFALSSTRDGCWTCAGRLTGPVGAKLKTVLDALAKPRLAPPDPSSADLGDLRTHAQRMHDALDEVCDRVLREGTGTGVSAGSAQVIVMIDLQNLLNQTGHGTTADGTTLSARQILDLAQEATIIPACFNSTGRLVDLGRSRRLASADQARALAARDGGCSFPGCDRAPQWCERHHILSWLLGGETNLDNLTLLCPYHHHQFASRGWVCRMDDDTGIPEWIPPRWVDKHQIPIVNSRILTRLHARCRDSPTLRRPDAELRGAGTGTGTGVRSAAFWSAATTGRQSGPARGPDRPPDPTDRGC